MKNFDKLLTTSLKEFARDRTTLSFTVIVPLLLVVFFGFAFSGAPTHMVVGLGPSPGHLVGGSERKLYHSVLKRLGRDPNVKIERGSGLKELENLDDGSIDAAVVITPKLTHVFYARGDGQVALGVRALATEIAGSDSTARRVTSRVERQAWRSVTVKARGSTQNRRLDYVVPGILATAIMWLGIFSSIPLVQQREQQVLRRFAATPVSPARLVLAQTTGRLFVSLCQAVFVLLAARLLFGVPVGSQFGPLPEALLVIVALVLLGALAFVAMGYAIAALSATQSSAHAWAQLSTMPMLLLAGVFFPISVLPVFLKPLVALLPLTYLADALRQSALSGQHFAPIEVDLIMLGAWVVAPLVVAIRYFRWS